MDDELKERILRDGKAIAEGGDFLREYGITYHSLAKVKRIREDNSIELE